MLELKEANEFYLKQYKEAYLLSLKKIDEGLIKKHDMMFLNPEENDIVQIFKDNKDESKLPSHYVPSYDYFAVLGDKFIGIIHIRVRLTPLLLNFGGHIGYGVNPKYWRQGYGKQILKLGLEKAKELIKEDMILVTCDDDNIGSYKIIEANGGKLENKVQNEACGEVFLTRRYWIKNRI